MLGDIQIQITRPTYETWFKDTVGIEYTNNILTVGAPNIFIAEMLQNRMFPLIIETARRIISPDVDLKFILTGPNSSIQRPSQRKPSNPKTRELISSPSLPLNNRYTFESFIV